MLAIKKKKKKQFNITTIFILLLCIYYIKNIIVINNNKYNDNNSYYYNSNNNNNNNTNTIIANIISSIVNNSNIVYANTLTNNRVLYMDESGKLATSVVEEKKLGEIDNKQNKLTDMTITSVNDDMYISNVDLTNNSNQRFTLSTLWNYLKGKITLLVYPVGSVYITMSSSNPATLFGGSWSKLKDGVFLENTTGTAVTEKQAGLPNIVGTFAADNRSDEPKFIKNPTGAFARTVFITWGFSGGSPV